MLFNRQVGAYGNLSPNPPHKDAIPPHRKQWGGMA